MNDYTFPGKESGFSQNQFKIFYSISDGNYYIKDLGEGLGTFVRVDTEISVGQGYVFTFGSCHISISYKDNYENDPDKSIYIQTYDSNKAKDQLYYNSNK